MTKWVFFSILYLETTYRGNTMDIKITAENLKNLNDGETIETLRGTFKIERLYDQINLYENGKLVSRSYLSEYTSNDGNDKAWVRLYNHLTKWLNLELGY